MKAKLLNYLKIDNLQKRIGYFNWKLKIKRFLPTRRRRFIVLGLVITIPLILAINTLLDLRNAQASWWNGTSGGGSWLKRQNVPVVNNSGDNLASGTTVAITVNTMNLVSMGKLQTDCDDLRVLYTANGTDYTELTRFLSYPGGGSCSTSEATKVYFKLNAALNNNTTDDDYYIYYGNTQATTPSNTDNAFDLGSKDATLVCPFDGTTTCAATETPSTATGAIRYSGSKSALSFDGINDTVTISDNSILEPDGDMTVELWFKLSRLPSVIGASKRLVAKSHTVDPFVSYDIYVSSANDTVAAQWCNTTDSGGCGNSAWSGTTLSANTWYHVALVKKDTTISLYLDGVKQNDGAGRTGTIKNSDSSLNLMYTIQPSYTSGQIDEVRLSNVARYTSNFTPTTVPFIRDEHTNLLLHFDENGSQPTFGSECTTGEACDDSGNGNHGTITGAKYVSGLVGVDASTSDTGNANGGNTYASHEGLFLEEDTTNKITNPSFENSTYNTNWTASASATLTDNTTAPYYKFGSHSAKVVDAGSNGSLLTTVNTGATTHTLSAYVYDGTSGNIGGTVGSSIANLMFKATPVATTYTDMGGGWWRLSYSGTGVASNDSYGVQVLVGKTVYIDGVQLEPKNGYSSTGYTTSYVDGSLGTGYSWSGTADNSTSTRDGSYLRYSDSGNVTANSGTVSFWVKRNKSYQGDVFHWEADSQNKYTVFVGTESYGAGFQKYAGGSMTIVTGTIDYNVWAHVVASWSNSNGMRFCINNTCNTDPSTTVPTGLSGNPFTIGYSDTLIEPNGVISDFRIYNTDLTTTEIQDLYYSGLVSHSQTYEVDAFSSNKGQNPVGIYHFDESSGSTAHDSSTYGNDLTLSATSWSTLSVGGRSQLMRNLKFDGSTSMASVSANVAREMNFGTDNFSLSGWFRHPSTVSGTDTLIAKYDSAGYKVYMNSSGFICFGIDDDSSFGPDDSACSTVSYADSNWHNFNAVRDTSSITLYVDGNNVGYDSTLSATGTLNNTANFAVGVDSNKTNYWDGFIDEIVVYPYARSSDQIEADVLGAQTSSSYGSQSSDPLTQGLVGYWKMDETSWTNNCSTATVLDSSGNGKNGLACPSSTGPTGGAAGKFGNAGNFDDSDDYVDTNEDNLYDITGPLTISAWIYHDTNSAVDHIISKNNNGGESPYQLSLLTTDQLRYFADNGGLSDFIDSTDTVSLISWHHVAMTRDTSNIYFYIDGKPDSGNPHPLTPGAAVASNVNLIIGARGNHNANYFDGNIDEVRIYNRVLTPAEVSQLYNWAPGPVGYWKMDEGTGTSSSNDSSGNNGTITLNNSPTWSTGKFGTGLSFLSANSHYATAAHSTPLNLGATTDSYTVSAWFKLNSVGTNDRTLLEKDNPFWGGDSPFTVHVNTDPNVKFIMRDNSSNTPSAEGATAITANQWYYVTAVRDVAADQLRIYLNGVLDGSATDTTTVEAQNSTNVYFGRGINGTNYLDGTIDDVKIYNYARTPAQIIEDMNAGHPAPGSPVGSALIQYNFDEGYGDTGNNSGNGGAINTDLAGASACPGNSSCPSWTNDGKFGKALSFDGSNDYAQTSSTVNFASDKITVAFWLYWNAYANDDDIAMELSSNFNSNNGTFLINPNSSIGFPCNTSGRQFEFAIQDTAGSPAYRSECIVRPSAATWHHYAVVFDNSTTTGDIKVFVDGLDTETTTGVNNKGSSGNFKTDTLYFMSRAGSSLFGAGKMDDVKIYTSELTADQVKQLYNQGKAEVFGSTSTDSSGNASWSSTNEYCPPGQGSTCTAPVAEWKFDEKTGTSVNDTSGNGNAGTLTDPPAWSRGKIGQALNFNGTSNYVTVDSSFTALDGKGAMTVSAWVKPGFASNAGSRPNRTVVNRGTWTSPMIRFQDDGSQYYIACDLYNSGGTPFNASNAFDGTPTWSANTWHHVLCRYTGNELELYWDGQLIGTDDTATGNIHNTSGNFTIGSTGAAEYFSGLIDNLRIYDYSLSNAQIAWEYNRGAPVGWWKFDECSGTVANDSSGNGFNGVIDPGDASGDNDSVGTCSSGDSTQMWNDGTTGKRGASLGFDNINDVVTVADNDALSFGNSSTDRPVSFSAWVKENSADSNFTIIEKHEGANTEYRFRVLSDNLTVEFFDASAGASYIGRQYSAAFSATNWTYVTATYDGSGTVNGINLYINSVLVDDIDRTGGSYTSMENTAQGLEIGDIFNGQIDEVKIFNYALTAQQIRDNFNAGSVHFGP